MIFYKIDGTKIEDTAQYIKNYIIEYQYQEISIMIGCDSLPKNKNMATFVVVICLYKVGKGAHIIYSKKNQIKHHGTADRLWKEVYRAVEVATYLVNSGLMKVGKIIALDIHLHLDLNTDKKNKSNAILEGAMGYVKAMGFDCKVKPEAPAASYAADWLCRDKQLVPATFSSMKNKQQKNK